MAKIIEGNLILDKDTIFDESLEVHGSILGKNGKRYNLTVNGNITAEDITAWDISAKNITAKDISAEDIIAMDIISWDITAGNINAKDINAVNIDTRNINAINIDAEDIDAEDIDAVDIKARDIDASGITARDITAGNITTINISARNINADFIICEELVQKPDSTLTATKVINNRSSYNQSAIDNSQFIKQEESIKQDKCNACGQVLRGKESNKLSEKLK